MRSSVRRTSRILLSNAHKFARYNQLRNYAIVNNESQVSEALNYASTHGAQMASIRFCDLYGLWQTLQVPISEVSLRVFEEGFAFDGSSIRGWQGIEKSDMLMIPIASTRIMDPFSKYKTVNFIGSVRSPDGTPYDKDPRYVAIKAAQYLKSTGIAQICNVGPEAEFFVFDSVSYEVEGHKGSYAYESAEATWDAHKPHSGQYKMKNKEGYFPVAPWDTLEDIRSEMVLTMERLGITVEASHHEVAAAGQCEIDFRFNDMVTTGDNLLYYKYVVRNVAAKHGKIATFMPKPIWNDNGSGMHTHVSLHEADGKNLFTGNLYAGLSQLGLYFIGGLIKHAKTICAFSNPTVNSYKRLVPGFEAPINFAYSGRNRSAAMRIPSSHPRARRVEFRTPDPSCNGYLNFAAILMAGIDGIQNKIDPGTPLDKDIYSLSKEELKDIPKAPANLEEAMDALETQNSFLKKGNVFTDDLINVWIERKRTLEIDPSRKVISPWEVKTYFDA